MNIAFTSCMSTEVFPAQPVWRDILKRAPDCLLLTGDSIYIDGMPDGTPPKKLWPDDFGKHLFALYAALLRLPEFEALIQATPTYAIWDDHDFLWNESYREKAIKKNVYKDLIFSTRASFIAFREALAGTPFPVAYNDARLWTQGPPPGYQYEYLAAADVALHLTDGRSWRVNDVLLGEAQKAQIEANIRARPDAVHLLVSGSVVETHAIECWGTFQGDYQWLLGLAREFRILVVSGDIHDNRMATLDLGAGGRNRYLYEATASGAAIRKLVSIGAECRNYGVLEIDQDQVAVSLFMFEQLSNGTPLRIDRNTWLPR